MGQVYFYNLSAQGVTLNVNEYNGDSIAGLGSAPYKPNASSNTYTRYDTAQPQQGQIGTANSIEYNVGSGAAGGKVKVTVNVDFGAYPENVDLIVYLYNSAIVIVSPSDSKPYLGTNGGTVTVGPGSTDIV